MLSPTLNSTQKPAGSSACAADGCCRATGGCHPPEQAAVPSRQACCDAGGSCGKEAVVENKTEEKCKDKSKDEGCCKAGGCSSNCESGKATAACEPPVAAPLGDAVCCKPCGEGKCCGDGCCSERCVLLSLESQTATVVFSVAGMTCSDCAVTAERQVRALPSVSAVSVSSMTGKMEVTFDAAILHKHAIAFALGQVGFAAAPQMANSLRSALVFEFPRESDAADVSKAAFELDKGIASVAPVAGNGRRLEICYDREQTLASAVFLLVSSLAPNARYLSPADIESEQRARAERMAVWRWQWRFWVSLLLAIPTFVIAFVFPSTGPDLSSKVAGGLSLATLVLWILATPVQAWIAAPLYDSAWLSLRFSHKPNADVLIVVSSSVAYFYSAAMAIVCSSGSAACDSETFFESATLLITLICLGRYLEVATKRRTAAVLQELALLRPASARLLPRSEMVPADVVSPGERVLVLPGEQTPVDAVVERGESLVDESMITGETVPVAKGPGSKVFCATLNQSGALTLLCSADSQSSSLSAIRQMIEKAQSSKPRIQQITDQLASYFVPIIIVISLVVFLVWIAVASVHAVDTHGSQSFPFALKFALALLVVSCPCAVGLAVPTAVMVGTGVGARKMGVLFRGADCIQNLQHVNVVAFDKTGTLTEGCFSVLDIAAASGCTERRLLSCLHAAEALSDHPIANSIVQYIESQGDVYDVMAVHASETVAGRGVRCSLDDGSLLVGSRTFLLEEGVPDVGEIEALGTAVYVALNQSLIGCLRLVDRPRPEAAAVVGALKKRGLRVAVLSGDRDASVAPCASAVGIDEYHSALLPAEKAVKVDEWRAAGDRVLFVGDGLNDTPALAAANVGMAVSSASSLSLSTADVVLLRDCLGSVIGAIDLAQAIFRVVHWNLFWAFLYNAVAIPLAAGVLYPVGGVYIDPAFAGLSEVISSFPVVLCSLTLNWFRPRRFEASVAQADV